MSTVSSPCRISRSRNSAWNFYLSAAAQKCAELPNLGTKNHRKRWISMTWGEFPFSERILCGLFKASVQFLIAKFAFCEYGILESLIVMFHCSFVMFEQGFSNIRIGPKMDWVLQLQAGHTLSLEGRISWRPGQCPVVYLKEVFLGHSLMFSIHFRPGDWRKIIHYVFFTTLYWSWQGMTWKTVQNIREWMHLITIGSIFNPLAGKFSGHTWQKPKRHERSRSMCTLLIGQNISDQSEPADLIWRQHGGNTMTRWQTCIVNGCETVQVASNGVTICGDKSYHSLAVHYSFGVARSSLVCMTHSEEPRAAKSGLRFPNETEYSGPSILRPPMGPRKCGLIWQVVVK